MYLLPDVKKKIQSADVLCDSLVELVLNNYIETITYKLYRILTDTSLKPILPELIR